MPGVSLFFDTNILIYAHDELSPFHEKCGLLLDLALSGEIKGIISEQNIIELYRILTSEVAMSAKPLTPSIARSLIERTYLTGRFKIVYPTKETLKKTIEIAHLRRLSSARIFDVRLYVQALQHRPTYFVTYNIKDFKGLGDLVIKSPDEIV
jgi:predicted nucleic acid-binding protein